MLVLPSRDILVPGNNILSPDLADVVRDLAHLEGAGGGVTAVGDEVGVVGGGGAPAVGGQGAAHPEPTGTCPGGCPTCSVT